MQLDPMDILQGKYERRIKWLQLRTRHILCLAKWWKKEAERGWACYQKIRREAYSDYEQGLAHEVELLEETRALKKKLSDGYAESMEMIDQLRDENAALREAGRGLLEALRRTDVDPYERTDAWRKVDPQ